jgi:hypothetical protein
MKEKMQYILKKGVFPMYMDLKRQRDEYNAQKDKFEIDEQEMKYEYLMSLDELKVKKEELNKKLKENEELANNLRGDLSKIDDLLEETKLKNELKELIAKNKLEEVKLNNEKDIEMLKLELEREIKEKKTKMDIELNTDKKKNIINRIELQYKILKEIYNEKEFDELIDLAQKRCDEMIIDEMENYKEQNKELESFRQKTNQKIDNLKEKNKLIIEKKKIELNNYKLVLYNKFLEKKKSQFNDLKKIFGDNKVCNDNLKNKEIEKAKMYFEQQKGFLLNKENMFQQQKQYIQAFIKQLEINNDKYSNNLKNQLVEVK